MTDESTYSTDVTADDVARLVAIRDLWQIVSRQIERRLLTEDLTGKIELHLLHSIVKEYRLPEPRIMPEEEERRQAERRAAPRAGDDRRRQV